MELKIFHDKKCANRESNDLKLVLFQYYWVVVSDCSSTFLEKNSTQDQLERQAWPRIPKVGGYDLFLRGGSQFLMIQSEKPYFCLNLTKLTLI